jgi:polysaccharide export outer membrane protein
MNTFRLPLPAPAVFALAAVLLLPACSSLSQSLRDGEAAVPGAGALKSAQKSEVAPLLSREDLALLEESANPVYRIGSVFISDLTREAAVQALNERLGAYFTRPHSTLAVEEYTSNQVTVLGRVERAGMQKFGHPPTLAEVLANAGAMPILDKQATLTRAAIMRGREKLIWVDLKALLNGDPAYNIRMKKGDIVYIPDSSDTAVYVLGAVTKPGSYRLTPRMTVLDALAQAGGATENAEATRIGVYRAGAKKVEIIDMAVLIDPSRRVNYALEDGDVIMVPNSGIADFGYIMRQIAPAISVLTFGLGINNAFGL